jgi:hypothetical protein
MKFSLKKFAVSAVIAVAGFGLAGCSTGSDPGNTSQANNAASTEASAQGQDSTNLINNQPVPVYKFSQARQILIDAQNIEANGENTTTFGLSNNGLLVWHCSSIGMPVPASAQLTNPEQQVIQPDGGGYQQNQGDNTLPQMDPYGIYTGQTTGTYTLCAGTGGHPYLQYWEGYTDSVSGPATYDDTTHQVVMQGQPIKITSGAPSQQTPVSSPNASASH